MKFLSVFTESNNSFEGQRPYENVILILNRHWFVLFSKIIAYLLMFFLPLGLFIFFGSLPVFANAGALLTVLFLVYLLFWWFSFFYAISMYFLDTWIITNHRVIDSEQMGFFNRTVSELSLSKIQDISTNISGPIATWLKFGELDIQTAGTNPKFCFHQIPDPVAVEEQLMTAHNEFMSEHPGGVEIHDL